MVPAKSDRAGPRVTVRERLQNSKPARHVAKPLRKLKRDATQESNLVGSIEARRGGGAEGTRAGLGGEQPSESFDFLCGSKISNQAVEKTKA